MEQIEQVIGTVATVGPIVAGLLRLWVTPIQKDIKTLADSIAPMKERIRELGDKFETMRVEQAQHAVRMEARQAQEESLRAQLQTIAGEMRDISDRLRDVEFSQAHQGAK